MVHNASKMKRGNSKKKRQNPKVIIYTNGCCGYAEISPKHSPRRQIVWRLKPPGEVLIFKIPRITKECKTKFGAISAVSESDTNKT